MAHPTFIDKYQIIKPLGKGNFGQVYHAFDRALKAEKAIKVLKTNDPTKFLQSLEEAQILRRCKHKHIVSINEANVFMVEKDKRVVLDLEYVPEGSLESALASRFLSAKDAITYVRGALLGLEHAHSQGFLHRDIKPGNILLSPNTSKLSDFGLATQTASPAATGSAQGYITHLPPEYFVNSATSVKTDVFAAGVTLFRAVSNISAWRSLIASLADADLHVQKGTLIKTIGFESHVPAVIQRIIKKACSANPDKRYDSAKAFRQQLDRLRFSIDWIRVSETEWMGASVGDIFDVQISRSRNALTVRKNGRRINDCCGKYSTFAEAMNAQREFVAKTTVKV